MFNVVVFSTKIALFCTLMVLFVACNKEESQPAACEPPAMLVAQSTCESGFQGTLLIASEFKEMPMSGILFEVFPQKDTLSNDLSVRAYKNGSDQHERFLVGDAIIGDAPKFLAQVTFNCSGKEIKSKYFAFVKRPAANPACFVWRQQVN